VFHPTEGSKVLCQIPSGAVVPEQTDDSSALSEPLLPFYCVKNYVIPKPPLCNRLVAIKINNYRVVGHPVHIYGSEYERNSFIFNFAFVFPVNADSIVYEMSIRRLARMFMALEEQSRYLSTVNSLDTINNIIEQIYQDLNNYSECQIPIDQSNSVNMKLFPLIPPPPEVESFHVPISTVRLDALTDENWDPTMEKIVRFINGINSIRRIADLADADYTLTKQCIQHLMHYRCLVIVDIFQFSNIYAVTSDICQFLTDPDVFREFQAYVYKPQLPLRARLTSNGSGSQVSTSVPRSTPESHSSLLSTSSSSMSTVQSATPGPQLPTLIPSFNLYRSLHQGVTVYDWYVEHHKQLKNIDVRRFISFGVIKGLIYRVHSYPIYDSTRRQSTVYSHVLGDRRTRLSRTSEEFRRPSLKKGYDVDTSEAEEIDAMVAEIMRQPRHFDSICTDLRLPRRQVEKILQRRGDWAVVSA
jgi:hypothetical protein